MRKFLLYAMFMFIPMCILFNFGGELGWLQLLFFVCFSLISLLAMSLTEVAQRSDELMVQELRSAWIEANRQNAKNVTENPLKNLSKKELLELAEKENKFVPPQNDRLNTVN